MPMKKEKKKSFKKQLITLWVLLISPIIFFAVFLYLISLGVFGELPTFDQLENPKSNQATEVYTADGRLLGKYFVENRSQVSYKDISPYVIDALVATEDERYYDHSGIDVRGLTRAVAYMGSKGGASTVTQQLAKMLFHKREKGNIFKVVIQKLKEWIIAIRLERHYTKDEILAMYLNRFDFINNAVGIKSAAQVYFNTSCDSLNIQESAMLVGMAKNPSLFNPRRRLEMTTQRRNVVLKQMVRNEKLTEQEYDSLKQLPIILDYRRVDHKEGMAPYFRETLRAYLGKIFREKDADGNYKIAKPNGDPYNIYRDGLKVFTTLDSRLQRYGEYAVTQHLGTELQKDFTSNVKRSPNAPFARDVDKARIDRIINRAVKRSDLYRELKAEGLSQDSINKVFNTKVPMKVFSWGGEIDTVMSPREHIRYNKFFLKAGMMSVDPHTGYIKAWVGGINYKHFAYDHVQQGKRQIGSTIKPFVYALAIIDKGLSPCYEVPNVPYTFEKGEYELLKDWTPHNPGREYGYDVTLKYGLANSMNTITAWVMKQVSPQAVVDFVKKAGIESEMEPVPSLCLGVPTVSLYEMVGAYSSLANKGQWQEPIFVTRIVDKDGNEIYNNLVNRKSNTVMSERNAYVMLELMKGVSQYNYCADLGKKKGGTAIRLRFDKSIRPYGGIPFDVPIAGKTGTTQDHSDGWFIGITPDLVTGVWVGADDRDIHFSNLSKGSGTNMALPIWGYYMNKTYEDESLKISQGDFEKPEEPINLDLNCDGGGDGNSTPDFSDEPDWSR
ncbi:transglycosylase domain-containing protein [bacterium SCSIO 12741]|nr:transglycosylase domain-containing protein [bacterium SCSIO 12741]